MVFLSCAKLQEQKIIPNSMCISIATMPEIDSLGVPAFLDSIGNAHLQISDNRSVQKWFDQGLNLLHGFWHIEAFRSFREIVKIDSTNAMAWWGIAMCQPGFGGDYYQPFLEAIQKAQKYKSDLPQLHQDIIGATAKLVSEGINGGQTPFRQLYHQYPDNTEVAALASIILRMHEDEATQQEVKSLLERHLKLNPNHTALLHYYIHLMETRPTEYRYALDEATLLIRLAPKSPHMVHMAGHLYYIAGDYKKALQVFQRCLDIEEKWHNSENIPKVHNQNYIHNLHFMALCYSELGDKDKALKYATLYERTTYRIGQPRSGGTMMLLYEGRILPALVYLRHGDYKMAADKLQYWVHQLDYKINQPVVKSYLLSMFHYAVGMDAAKKQDKAAATYAFKEMMVTFNEFEQLALQKEKDIEFKIINDTHDILNMAHFELAGWIDNMDVTKPFNDLAWREAIDLEKAIKYDEPPRLMYPIEESLAKLHFSRGEEYLGQKAISAALLKRPNSKMAQKNNMEISIFN